MVELNESVHLKKKNIPWEPSPLIVILLAETFDCPGKFVGTDQLFQSKPLYEWPFCKSVDTRSEPYSAL